MSFACGIESVATSSSPFCDCVSVLSCVKYVGSGVKWIGSSFATGCSAKVVSGLTWGSTPASIVGRGSSLGLMGAMGWGLGACWVLRLEALQ